MLKIQSNSRQVPKVKIYTANKMYFDLLYGVLQEMSYMDFDDSGNRIRCVDKKEIKFVDLAERIGLTRQSVSTKFKNLIELGLIELRDEEGRYVIHTLDGKEAALIPLETLRILNNTLSHNCINVFVYLLNRYVAAECEEYMVTLGQIKSFVGLSEKSRSNNEVITDILWILQRLGLVEYKLEFSDGKKYYVISKVNSRLQDA